MNTGRTKPVLRTLLLSWVLLFVSMASSAQQEREQEVVASLAAGRVVLYVAKDGIAIGAIEQRVEPGSHPPLVLSLGGPRVGILLGAVEWITPGSGQPVRLDRELPALASEAAPLRRQAEPQQASDIEAIGVALLERLRVLASQLHRKLDLLADRPLVELLLVNYVESYGPEVWLLRYRVAQDPLRGDFWRTRVLRPSYIQLYPPEKGQPRTLIEVRFSADDAGPTLLDLLNQNDPRLARLRTADQPIARAIERLRHGESNKASAADAEGFLRAALDAIADRNAKLILGVLYEQRGLEWVLAPPELPQTADERKPREPGAPTLRKKP